VQITNRLGSGERYWERPLLDYAALGLFDEADDHGNILALVAFGFEFFQSLREVLSLELNNTR